MREILISRYPSAINVDNIGSSDINYIIWMLDKEMRLAMQNMKDIISNKNIKIKYYTHELVYYDINLNWY